MTRLKCSADGCPNNMIRTIKICGRSPMTKRKYMMDVNVCMKHYELEQKAGAIIK